MSEAKPTPGPWSVFNHSWCETSISAPSTDNAICLLDINHATEESQEADEAQMAANARLIADAGTVFHTTGLTPSQLVERVKELEEAAKLVLDWYEAENDHSKTDFYQRVQMCRDSEDALRAALSKARPNTAEGDPGRCMGTRCTASAVNGYAHSRECIDEAGEAQRWKPTAEDYAKCGPSAAEEPSP